jgi:hypothetical protein
MCDEGLCYRPKEKEEKKEFKCGADTISERKQAGKENRKHVSLLLRDIINVASAILVRR